MNEYLNTSNSDITRREVRVIQVDKRCPKCHIGFLRPTGIVCSINPPVRPHKCTNCDYGETVKGNAYPYLVYEPIVYPIQVMDGNSIQTLIDRECFDEELRVDPNMVISREPEYIREDHEKPSNKTIDNYPPKSSGK
jgi:hypothetical protein